MGQADVV